MAFPFSSAGSRRMFRHLATFAAAVTALALAAPPADAHSRHPATPHRSTGNAHQHSTTGRTAASGPMTHPDADHLGSTIRSHEHVTATAPIGAIAAQVSGLDVSGYQANVDWNAVKNNGGQFAYVKATENTTYQNPYFAQQYNGSYGAGLIRGAYHFALPDRSSGAVQADYFASNGGGWTGDGRTLPPMLDIEYNPYGATCYGLSPGAMSNWIADFVNELHNRTGRWATIYTTTNWWSTCTGNNGGFGANNPLFIANYNGSPGPLPAGWGFQTFWQFADHGTFPGDQDLFNGAYDRLQALAGG